MEFKYSDNGVLYSFSDSSQIYSNISGNVKLEKTQVWQIFLENEGSITYETKSSYPFGVFTALLINILVIKRKKRKNTSE